VRISLFIITKITTNSATNLPSICHEARAFLCSILLIKLAEL